MRAYGFWTAVAMVVLATSARAELTPQEVWASWQTMMTSAGQELTVGAVSDTGSIVEVSDVLVTLNDQGGTSIGISYESLRFAGNADGTVTVTMPDSYPVQMAFPAQEDGPGSMKLTVDQPGFEVVAGGSAAEPSYAFTAPVITVTLDEVTDGTGKILDTQADLALTDVQGSYRVTKTGAAMGLQSSFAAKSMVLNLSGQGNVEAGAALGEGKVTASFADLNGSTNGNFLPAEQMENLAAALKSGFQMESLFNFGAVTVTADVTEPDNQTSFAATATGGGFDLVMNKDRMRYGTAVNGVALTISGADIPFPQLDLAFAESGFSIDMPVSKSESPQDFTFLTKLVGFTVSGAVWDLIDPGETLSRDPATFVVDLKGTGFWTADILDPAVQAAGGEPPGELHSLALTQVLAKAAGAEVSATGEMTFDNSDLLTFDGLPRPEGTVSAKLTGVYGLIDKLTALGLLGEDEVTGFRLGLAMIAKPAAGPDALASEVAFKDGQLFVNGMRMR